MEVIAFLIGVIILVVYMGIWYAIRCELNARYGEKIAVFFSALGIIVFFPLPMSIFTQVANILGVWVQDQAGQLKKTYSRFVALGESSLTYMNI